MFSQHDMTVVETPTQLFFFSEVGGPNHSYVNTSDYWTNIQQVARNSPVSNGMLCVCVCVAVVEEQNCLAAKKSINLLWRTFSVLQWSEINLKPNVEPAKLLKLASCQQNKEWETSHCTPCCCYIILPCWEKDFCCARRIYFYA